MYTHIKLFLLVFSVFPMLEWFEIASSKIYKRSHAKFTRDIQNTGPSIASQLKNLSYDDRL